MTGASVGSMFEWYDFYLASVASASVWPRIFFPARFDPIVALAISFASVGIAYLVRPIGGLLFGHLGDKYGRRNTLMLTLVMMGSASLGTALLPPYASIGMLAIVVLFFLRVLMGVGFGGELGGALSWILEARPKAKHRGFWLSWPMAVLALGKLLSIFAFYLVSAYLSTPDYLNWGWRIPFATGAGMLAIALVIRVKILESPMFQQLQRKRIVLKYPAFQVIKEQWRKIFTLLWMHAYASVIPIFVILPYSISYLVRLGVDEPFANLSVTAGTAVAFFAMLGGGFVSDYVGRLQVVRIAGVLCIAILFPYFFLLQTLNPILIVVAQMLLYGFSDIPVGSNTGLFAESFPTKYRYSGSGITFQLIGGLMTGILLALLLPALIVTYGVVGAWQPVVWVSIAMVIISIAASFFVKETKGIAVE
jgi:MFS family permease